MMGVWARDVASGGGVVGSMFVSSNERSSLWL